jgi:hypothetical protein
MNHGSPFASKEKKKIAKAVEADVPLEKFKPLKPRLSRGSAKALVEVSCSPTELMWVERWLTNLVQTRSLPPQICGADAFDALTQFLAPQDALAILDQLRSEFIQAHPQRVAPKDDFTFLLNEVKDIGKLE